MKQKVLRGMSAVFAAVMMLSLVAVAAPALPKAPEIDSTSGVVFNLEKETILFEKNLDVRLSPAAFTKLMTALLAYEYRSVHGNVSVTVTEEMLSGAGGNTMQLKPGEVISMDSLLLGLVVANANDAALVLASTVGGNISSFVEKMNLRAKEMGMTQTYYTNPMGIDAALMYTTMKDTLTLCRAVYRVNDYILASEKDKVVIPGTNLSPERVYTNKNALVPFSYVTDYYLPGVRGMIAGYTGNAGHCVATVREKKGCTNLVILSGGRDRSEGKDGTDISSYRDAKNLLEWAESNYRMETIVKTGSILVEKKVLLSGSVDHVILVAGEDFSMLLPEMTVLSELVTTKIVVPEEDLLAPVIEGDAYGVLEVYYKGDLVGEIPLVAGSGVARSQWLLLLSVLESFFAQGPARVILILIILGGILYIAALIAMVWVQYSRKNRAKKIALDEINRLENLRLRQVRQDERKANLARLHRAGTFLRAGYQVLSGEAEVIETVPKRKKIKPHKAVAKVPEQYRRKNRTEGENPSELRSKTSSSSPKKN